MYAESLEDEFEDGEEVRAYLAELSEGSADEFPVEGVVLADDSAVDLKITAPMGADVWPSIRRR